MASRRDIGQAGGTEISGTGLLLLAVVTLLASGVVFLLGIYVGKGMVEQRLQQESRVVRLPVPTPGAAAKSDEVDVTFWDKLGKGETTSPPAPSAPAAPTEVETPVRVVPSRPTPAPPAPRPTEKHVEAPPPPPPSRPPPPSLAEAGSLQIQVNAMSERARADELVRDLRGLGYSALISPARVGDRTLYRVRVAGIGSVEAAKAAVARLREQGYPNAFVVAGGE
jgi:cell division septation protein DedD